MYNLKPKNARCAITLDNRGAEIDMSEVQKTQSIKRIVLDIMESVCRIEENGIDCAFDVEWLDVDTARVTVSAQCDDFMICDASLTGSPERPELLLDLCRYLEKLATSAK